MCIYMESTFGPGTAVLRGHLILHPLGCVPYGVPAIDTGQIALRLGEPRRSQGSESEHS